LRYIEKVIEILKSENQELKSLLENSETSRKELHQTINESLLKHKNISEQSYNQNMKMISEINTLKEENDGLTKNNVILENEKNVMQEEIASFCIEKERLEKKLSSFVYSSNSLSILKDTIDQLTISKAELESSCSKLLNEYSNNIFELDTFKVNSTRRKQIK